MHKKPLPGLQSISLPARTMKNMKSQILANQSEISLFPHPNKKKRSITLSLSFRLSSA
jgi:hypothetical protein